MSKPLALRGPFLPLQPLWSTDLRDYLAFVLMQSSHHSSSGLNAHYTHKNTCYANPRDTQLTQRQHTEQNHHMYISIHADEHTETKGSDAEISDVM